jgi:transcriptional regulator with XRE-family HTH domain
MEINQTIGKNIRKHREAKEIKLEVIANAIGLSKGMLSQIENGIADIKLSHIKNIANYLKVDFYELISTPTRFITFNISPNSADITGDNNHLVNDQKLSEVLINQIAEKDKYRLSNL